MADAELDDYELALYLQYSQPQQVDNSFLGRSRRTLQNLQDNWYARLIEWRLRHGLEADGSIPERPVYITPAQRRGRPPPPEHSSFVSVDDEGAVVAKECCTLTRVQLVHKVTTFFLFVLLLCSFVIGLVGRYDAWLVIRRFESNVTLRGDLVYASVNTEEPFYQLHLLDDRLPSSPVLHGRCYLPPENVTAASRWRPPRGLRETSSESAASHDAASNARVLTADSDDAAAAGRFGSSGGGSGWPTLVDPTAVTYMSLQTCTLTVAALPEGVTVLPLSSISSDINEASARRLASASSVAGLCLTCLGLVGLWPLLSCGTLFGRQKSTWAARAKRAVVGTRGGRKGKPLQAAPSLAVYGVEDKRPAKPYIPSPPPQAKLQPGEGRDRPSIESEAGVTQTSTPAAPAVAPVVKSRRPCCFPCMVAHDDYPGSAWLSSALALAISAWQFYSADEAYREHVWAPLVTTVAAAGPIGIGYGNIIAAVRVPNSSLTAGVGSEWPLPGLAGTWTPSTGYLRTTIFMPGLGWGLTAVTFIMQCAGLIMLFLAGVTGMGWKFCKRHDDSHTRLRKRNRNVAVMIDDTDGRVLELPATNASAQVRDSAPGSGVGGAAASLAPMRAGIRAMLGSSAGQGSAVHTTSPAVTADDSATVTVVNPLGLEGRR